MSFSLKRFSQVQANIHRYAKVLKTVLSQRNDYDRIDKVDQILSALEGDHFQIAVVGEFSRGKSMLINAMLGEKVLPSSARVTTTILNHISYAEEPRIVLHKGEEQEEITQGGFRKLVAPKDPIQGDTRSEKEYKEQVEYIQSIDHADIQYPISFCKEGVIIIDTPGLADGDMMRDQLTSTIIPRSDAAVLILSAKAALSASEMTLIKERLLKNDIQKVFLVVNFKDTLESEAQEQTVLQHVKSNLRDVLGSPKVHLVSAKEALTTRRIASGEVINKRGRVVTPVPMEETGMLDFEEDLADFLQFDRGKVKLKRPLQQLLRLLDEVINDVNTEKKALMLDIKGLDDKLNILRNQLRQFEKSGNKALQKVDSQLKMESGNIRDWYKKRLSLIKQAGMRAFEQTHTTDEEIIMEEVEKAIAPLERQLHEDKVEYMQNVASDILKKGSQELNEDWKEINFRMGDLFTLEDSKASYVPAVDHNPPAQEYDLFQELYDELGEAWETSQGSLGKALVGVGIALVGIVEGGFKLLKSLFGDPFKEKRDKLRGSLRSQLSTKNNQKEKYIEAEWKQLSKGIKSKFGQTVSEQVRQKHQQLDSIEYSADMEKDEIHNRTEVLQKQISNLLLTKEAFSKSTSKLERAKEREVLQ